MAEEKKKLTVKEFKMWLQGVEEMQEESWVPNATQWKRIRAKIEEINETLPVITREGAQPVYAQPGMGVVVPGPTYVPSNIPPSPPPNLGAFAGDTPGVPVKTPAIDTSNGNYKSSFA